MNFWQSTLSALIAALVAGLILKIVGWRKQKDRTGGIEIARSHVIGGQIETNSVLPSTASQNTGNVDIRNSAVKDSKIKTNVRK
jgi:hypothetical protein